MSTKNIHPFDEVIHLAINSEKSNMAPTIFKHKEFKNFEDFAQKMIKNQYKYSATIFSRNYRKRDNFEFAQFIVLDVDSPDMSMSTVIRNIEYNGLSAGIITSKSHLKEKSGIICDRYHIFVMLNDIPEKPEEYIATAKKLSKLICGGKDDIKCHDAARFFYPSPNSAKVKVIKGDSLFDIVQLSDEDVVMMNRKAFCLRDEIEDKEYITPKSLQTYQKYLNGKTGIDHIISHYNDSNDSLNLRRDKTDQNPGCFMMANDNRIFDGEDGVKCTDFSYNQVTEAIRNDKFSLEDISTEVKGKVLRDIKPKVEFNIINTSEGLGKSSLVFDYIEKYKVPRAVIVCKSYGQVEDKKKTYNKFNPEKNIQVILGAEKFLDKYNVHENEWIWGTDKETNEKFISLRKTIEGSVICGEVKARAYDEIEYYAKVIAGDISVDLILMVEDKLRMEVLNKSNFCDEGLIIYDEFNHSHWFRDRVATDWEVNAYKFKEDRLYDQETWQGFHTKMIQEKNNYFTMLAGKKIILTTENQANRFFTHKYGKEFVNIVEHKTVFISKKVTYHSVNRKLINKENKAYLAEAFKSNKFLLMGNGIQSKLNHVAMKGKNLHEVIKDGDRIVLILNQPSPAEIAPVMKNLSLNDHEATILLLADILNQYLGRCNGFRETKDMADFESFDVLLPQDYINEVLPMVRYVANIKRTITDLHMAKKRRTEPRMFDKIIHTAGRNAGVLRKTSARLYLASMNDKISRFLKDLQESGTKIISKFPNMRAFQFSKEQLSLGKSKIEQLRDKNRYAAVYKKVHLDTIIYGESKKSIIDLIDSIRETQQPIRC